jgi:hypothetical protein
MQHHICPFLIANIRNTRNNRKCRYQLIHFMIVVMSCKLSLVFCRLTQTSTRSSGILALVSSLLVILLSYSDDAFLAASQDSADYRS